jgi:hypothetical protein
LRQELGTKGLKNLYFSRRCCVVTLGVRQAEGEMAERFLGNTSEESSIFALSGV